MCDFDESCVWEEEIEEPIWRLCVERAFERDINKGGYFDAKDGCIQFWCGPEDQPEDWKGVPIRKGALNHPRSLVGGVYADYGSGSSPMTLHWLLYPYEKAAFLEGAASTLDLRHPAERYGTEEDLKWCRGKFRELVEWALREYDRRVPRYEGTVYETGLTCPFGPEHRVVELDPPFQSWEYYCLDCQALTCVREKLPAIKEGALGTIILASYPRERIFRS